ncbi:hypothetical protein HEN35_014465 [Escherichia coli]|jgi:23S rRNA maturation-related 3'-5' exoribonuclease YhaM|uniref:hypothetical protein n=1 Tax=Escherichia coli TaxID=562 RepID=UPI00038FE1DA|nr:hypothetical protein [Escherichia coli]MED9500011.1 hypothetical protein [Escherichia marmotae]EFB3993532.1 hypothetical protein [Escherichia coli]EFC3019666.1 hypothetical protein [Escherichia coli]EFC9693134.1 hypothetical protein [Escherichia coli]EFG2940067.1 hypothetical protein [Escherichia coli]
MIRKLLKIIESKPPRATDAEVQEVIDEIKKKQNEIAEKKEEIKNDRIRGARITNHRFIV